jgi:FlaA1/EpsC-like NDP-sugar epimerase
MGCTKRICELMVVGHTGPMACWAVRFGNVVGSRGSVVPIFERQIRQGGPVTITHPDVSRYLMTIREAVALVISTIRFASPAHVYMLDMGEPIRILDLAHDLIRARGLRPGTDIEIVSTGLRPGERLHEELLAPEEGWRPTQHAGIREVVSPARVTGEDLDWTVERLAELARERRTDELIRVLKRSVSPPAAVSQEAGTERRPAESESPREVATGDDT